MGRDRVPNTTVAAGDGNLPTARNSFTKIVKGSPNDRTRKNGQTASGTILTTRGRSSTAAQGEVVGEIPSIRIVIETATARAETSTGVGEITTAKIETTREAGTRMEVRLEISTGEGGTETVTAGIGARQRALTKAERRAGAGINTGIRKEAEGGTLANRVKTRARASHSATGTNPSPVPREATWPRGR